MGLASTFNHQTIPFKPKKLEILQGQWHSLGLDLVTVTLLVVDVAQATNQLFERPETDRDEQMRAKKRRLLMNVRAV